MLQIFINEKKIKDTRPLSASGVGNRGESEDGAGDGDGDEDGGGDGGKDV